MDEATNEQWRSASAAARAYRAGTLTWKEFMSAYGEVPANNLLGELVDLIEHQPALGGLGGVNEREFAKYLDDIDAAIRSVEFRLGAP